MVSRRVNPSLAGVGIWSTELREHHDRSAVAEAAAELESLGYSALLLPGRAGGDVLACAEELLRATQDVTVATGILNIWVDPAERVARRWAELSVAHPGRFLLGLGVSHAALVDRNSPGRYRRPVATMQRYLDALDDGTPPVPREGRMLAALGPRMLTLARERTAGAHPYLVTVEHTRRARELLGPNALLAPEQTVILEPDPGRARELGHRYLARYLDHLPNYANNFRRLGFADDELRGGGSDRLVDDVIAWGDEQRVADRVAAHREAGANHVCLQVVMDTEEGLPLDAWRRLAPAVVSV
jgi:probable F420-dependent oxidoreductase